MSDRWASGYAGRRVAVTGAGGYVGSALVNALRQGGASVLRVSRQRLPAIVGTQTWRGDLEEKSSWAHIVSKSDVIFHLAGNTSVYASISDPGASLRSTVLPVTLLSAAAQELRRCPRVVFASTATVYGMTDSFPVSEDLPPRPITNYDLHKIFAEQQLQLATAQGILEAVSLRLGNVYGPSEASSSSGDRGVLNRITRAALEGATLSVYGGGAYIRDYVYIDDVVRAFMAAGVAEEVRGRTFNVASGRGVRIIDAFRLVADRVAKATQTRVEVEAVAWPAGTDEIEFRNFIADVRALSEATGWQPRVQLEEGIDALIADLRAKLATAGARASKHRRGQGYSRRARAEQTETP